MGVVVIAGNNYTVYGDLPSAKVYIGGLVGPGATAFLAGVTTADDDRRGQMLNSAKNLIDRQSWQGLPVSALPALQWPRTGVTVKGVPVDPAVIPVAIVNAEYELAAMLSLDSTVYGAANSGTNVKLARIDKLEVENFRPIAGTKLPSVLMDMVGMYLGATGSTFGGVLSGTTDSCGNAIGSQFDDVDTYSRDRDF